MSIAYLLNESGVHVIIEDEILDEAGILQTDINDFILEFDGGTRQIFFTDGIPLDPVLGSGAAELFTSWHESTTFVSYNERTFIS